MCIGARVGVLVDVHAAPVPAHRNDQSTTHPLTRSLTHTHTHTHTSTPDRPSSSHECSEGEQTHQRLQHVHHPLDLRVVALRPTPPRHTRTYTHALNHPLAYPHTHTPNQPTQPPDRPRSAHECSEGEQTHHRLQHVHHPLDLRVVALRPTPPPTHTHIHTLTQPPTCLPTHTYTQPTYTTTRPTKLFA